MIESITYECTVRFTSPLLGTVPSDPKVYETYIASKGIEKNPDKEDILNESETVNKIEERGWTGFHKDALGLFMYDYMVRGFIKSAMETLMENKTIPKIPAYKKWVDRFVFVYPRKIHFGKMEPDGVVERPLRGMTAQGPRVSLIRSDALQEGTEVDFFIEILGNSKKIDPKLLRNVFEYGRYVGLGQWWGSGGYGQFVLVNFSKVEAGVAV